jgi:hypothetical protein
MPLGDAHHSAQSSLWKLIRRRDFYPRRIDHPMLGRPRPIVPLNREPIRIIQGPSHNPPMTGSKFRSYACGGPTPRTKFYPQPPVTFVRLVFIRTQGAPYDFHVFFVEIGHYTKGTPGPPLAKRTMANACQVLSPHDAIAHGPTQTPTFMYVYHFTPPFLRPNTQAHRESLHRFSSASSQTTRGRRSRPRDD